MDSKISVKLEPNEKEEIKDDGILKEELLIKGEENFECKFEFPVKIEPIGIDCSFEPALYADHQIKEEMVIGPTEFQKQDTGILNNAAVISKTSYQCNICSETFKYKIGLNQHRRIEHNNNTTVIAHFFHQSKNKKAKFKKSSKYKKNIENDQNEFKSITCGVCFKHFAALQSLRSHMKRCPMLKQKSSENIGPKSKCDSAVVKNNEKVVIKKEVSENDVKIRNKEQSKSVKKENKYDNEHSIDKEDTSSKNTCPVCYKTFTFGGNLSRHMKYIHSLDSGNKKYRCDKCDMSYNRKDYLAKHNMVQHSQGKEQFYCECGRKFDSNWNLKRHQKYFCILNPSSKREKSLFCDHCNRGFSHKFVLMEHLKRHAREKTLICDFCKKVFPQKYLLIRHILHHMKVPEVMYECKICDKKFIRHYSLKKHLISHTGKKPFSCKFCGRGFRSRWGCLSHEKQLCQVMNEKTDR